MRGRAFLISRGWMLYSKRTKGRQWDPYPTTTYPYSGPVYTQSKPWSPNKPFACPVCGKRFQTVVGRDQHRADMHGFGGGPRRHLPPKQRKKQYAESRAQRAKHEARTRAKAQVIAKTRRVVEPSRVTPLPHIELVRVPTLPPIVISPRRRTCPLCRKRFETSRGVAIHYGLVHKRTQKMVEMVQCPRCRAVLKPTRFRRHLRRAHPELL